VRVDGGPLSRCDFENDAGFYLHGRRQRAHRTRKYSRNLHGHVDDGVPSF